MLSKHLRSTASAEPADASARVHAHGTGGNAGDAALLDPVALGRLAELDPKGENHLLERVLQAFQTSVARLRPQFEAARRSGDRQAIRLVAHTLKSSSASIGATQVSQLCAQVESAIRLEKPDDLGSDLDALGAALDGALQAIATLLEARA